MHTSRITFLGYWILFGPPGLFALGVIIVTAINVLTLGFAGAEAEWFVGFLIAEAAMLFLLFVSGWVLYEVTVGYLRTRRGTPRDA